MATNQSLPSPASRRHADPSNKPKPPDIAVEVAADAGDAVVTVPGFGAMVGVPACILSGGAHAAPLPCLTAEMTGFGTVTLHFAEAVANGDKITWPERDTSIRGRTGAYVGPQIYVVAGSTPTTPQIVDIVVNADDATIVLTFDQDMLAAGPSIQALVFAQDADGVQWQTAAITDVTGAVVTCDAEYSVQAPGLGASTSNLVGTALVGLVGGIAADDWVTFAATFTAPAGQPYPIHAINNTFNPGEQDIFWNVAVTSNGNTHNTTYDSGTTRYDNGGGGSNFSAWQTRVNCTNATGLSTNANTISMDADEVVGVVSTLLNAAFVNYPCPDEP